MGVLLRWPPLILGAAAHLLLLLDCAGSTSHSLRYFYTAVSEPGQGLPQFIAVGYMDDQQFVQYDSDTKEYLSLVPWMKKAEMEDPQYQERNNQNFQGSELLFRVSLQNLQNRYNQSGGIHTFQWMYGCELRSDGHKGGYYQYGYDGKDFIAFDKETLTSTAAETEAQASKRKWDANMAGNQYRKAYLEEECIEWLQKYLDYGKETLLRTVNLGLIVGAILGVMAAILLVSGIIFFIRRQWSENAAYEETPTSDQGPSSSTRASYQPRV